MIVKQLGSRGKVGLGVGEAKLLQATAINAIADTSTLLDLIEEKTATPLQGQAAQHLPLSSGGAEGRARSSDK